MVLSVIIPRNLLSRRKFKLMTITSRLIYLMLDRKKISSLWHYFARVVIGVLCLNIIGTGLAFLINIFLARLLDVAGYGIYAYVTSWLSLLGIPAMLGLDRLITRNVAIYQTQAAWGLMKGLLYWANRAVLLVSVGLALFAAGIAWTLVGQSDWHMLMTFWIGMFTLPFIALTALRQATLRALHSIMSGQILEMLIRPLLFIALVGGVYLLLKKIDVTWVMGLNLTAAGVTFILGAYLLQRILPGATRVAPPVFQDKIWLSDALPILLVTTLNVINVQASTLILGMIKGTEVVGLYNTAARGAHLIAFTLTAVNVVVGPTFARLYAAGEMQQLQRVVTRSSQGILFISLPLALGFIFFGRWFLLLFGPEFIRAQFALATLSVGEFVNAAMGSVGILLIMTGHERDAAVSIGVGTVVNVVLSLALIPFWGLEGAAVATTLSLIAWNLLMAILVYKRLHLYSTVLGQIHLRTHRKP